VRTSSSSRRGRKLLRELESARGSLQEFEISLRSAAVLTSTTSGSRLDEATILLGLVHQARIGLDRRLAELGALELSKNTGSVRPIAAPQSLPAPEVSTLSLCIDACRACGRALAAAFREAQKAADAGSARILYGPIRDLEKQIWVLDPRQTQ